MTRTMIAFAFVLAAAGCGSIRPAQMALPAGLQTRTQEARIEGLGGGRSGNLRVAGNTGRFTRAASQLALFEIASVDRGGSTFAVSGADFLSPVSARCRFRRNTVTLGIVDFEPKTLAYECDFDGLPGARLSLQEAARGVSKLQAERRGAALGVRRSGRVCTGDGRCLRHQLAPGARRIAGHTPDGFREDGIGLVADLPGHARQRCPRSVQQVGRAGDSPARQISIGGSPTSSLKRTASSVRDAPTSRASVASVQGSAKRSCSSISARPTRASAGPRNHPASWDPPA